MQPSADPNPYSYPIYTAFQVQVPLLGHQGWHPRNTIECRVPDALADYIGSFTLLRARTPAPTFLLGAFLTSVDLRT